MPKTAQTQPKAKTTIPAEIVKGKHKQLPKVKTTIQACEQPKLFQDPTAINTYTGHKGISEGYPGNASQVFQRTINQIPPHDVFYSGFAGKCAVLTMKKPATRNIATDLNKGLKSYWRERHHVDFKTDSFFSFVKQFTWSKEMAQQWFIYLDPPFRHATRRSGADIYLYELTEQQHKDIIKVVRHITEMSNAYIAIRHYPDKLYDELLKQGWRYIEYTTRTQRDVVTERLYMNYAEPTELHEYTHYGENFIYRQMYKRKREALLKKLAGLPPIERNGIITDIMEKFGRHSLKQL